MPYALKPRACESSGMLSFYMLTGAHLLSKLCSQRGAACT